MKTLHKILAGVSAIALAACNSNNTFTVKGEITNATDSVLYFENVSLEGVVALDSAKLSDSGTFSFSQDAQTAPEFYRLRIADQIINVSIDSTETVTVKAKYPTMASDYTIEGSEQCKIIQELTYKQMDLQAKAIAIQNSLDLSYQKSADSIMSLVEAYKEDISRNYIYKNIGCAASYFALFQALGDRLIFNPRSNDSDIKVFAAVATSWETHYPNCARSENLHNIAIEGMNNVRHIKNRNTRVQNVLEMAEESSILNIELNDNKGNMRDLKSLKGKVVLLDFHLFSANGSPQRIMQMREIYNKYHEQGLEIYQISIDDDQHFWKTQTEALPWISVNDPEGADSRYLRLYNVQSIPTFFLISRSNELVKRDSQIKDLDAEIRALL